MGRRIQARISNGRFTRNTLENSVGLRCIVCPHCNQLNPYGRKPIPDRGFIDPDDFNQWDVPAHCHECGDALPAENS